MQRTNTCGELRKSDINKNVILSGWVHIIRDKGSIIWIDLRDRYGITQLVFEETKTDKEVFKIVKKLGREFVIKVKGTVAGRSSINPNLKTGEIEIIVTELTILNESKIPPFTIEENTDGGEELRMKYRYLDIRRQNITNNLILRHKIVKIFREALNSENFIEIETPYLIKSTPEGARDFLVPSRLNTGKFYALPQSPQTFKQLLMVGGIDRYYQLARCFRDEDLRSDRQPEFSQIDCEMSFVDQEDIMNTFEKIVQQVFNLITGQPLPPFIRLTYDDAIAKYGSDKPDLRFGMPIVDIKEKASKCDFKIFEEAELVAGICIKGGSYFTRKQIDEYTDFVKTPQIGGKGLIYIKYNEDDSIKSSIDKFVMPAQMKFWFEDFEAEKGDLMFIVSGKKDEVRNILGQLRLKIASDLKLKDKNKFAALWVTDFPLLEWNEEQNRYFAAHHPFTHPKDEHIDKLLIDPEKVKAKAYDLVINGYEIAGGSIRIYKRELQEKLFKVISMNEKEAKDQFGFLLDALEFGAPPHGGIAFGLARLCAVIGKSDLIRDFIAFPKNNSARDVMIDAPSEISTAQLDELKLEHKSLI